MGLEDQSDGCPIAGIEGSAIEQHMAPRRRKSTGEHQAKDRLARARSSREPDRSTGSYHEVDFLQYAVAAEIHAQLIEFQNSLSRARSLARHGSSS